MSEYDIIPIGKLRRPRHPGAAVSYDPTWGVRVEGEDVPASPRAAGAWVKKSGGWIRIHKSLQRGHTAVEEFIKATRI